MDRFNPGTEVFTNYHHEPSDPMSLSSNDIRSFMKDKEYNIWICTSNGLNKVVKSKENDKTIIQFVKIPNKTEQDFDFAFENSHGQLLLFADTLCYIDKETYIITQSDLDLNGANVISVVEDKTGNLILGTSQTGVLKLVYDSQKDTYTKIDPGRINVTPNKRNILYVDSKNNLWIYAESRGIYRYNMSKDHLVNYMPDKLDDKSLSDNTTYSILEDHSGVLWIGTFSQGLCKYNLYRKEFDHFRSLPGTKNSLSGDVISSIHTIDPKELWVGLDLDGGVNRILFNEDKEPEFIHYRNDPNDDNSISGNNTLSLVQRKNGDVWIGSAGGIVTRLVPEQPQLK